MEIPRPDFKLAAFLIFSVSIFFLIAPPTFADKLDKWGQCDVNSNLGTVTDPINTPDGTKKFICCSDGVWHAGTSTTASCTLLPLSVSASPTSAPADGSTVSVITATASESGVTVNFKTGLGTFTSTGTSTAKCVVSSDKTCSVTIYSATEGRALVEADAAGHEPKQTNVQFDLYSATFTQDCKLTGTEWGANVGGTRYKTTSSTLSVPDLQGTPTYSYDQTTTSADGKTRCACTGSSCTGTVGQVKTFTAEYKTQYQLTLLSNPSAGGTASTIPAGPWYDSGASATISATANDGYRFKDWFSSDAGGYSGKDNPRTVILSSPITETANFDDIGPCARNSPAVSISPASQSTTTAGTKLTYTVSVTNRDTTKCQGTQGYAFTLSKSCPQLECTLSKTSLTIFSGNADSSATIDVKSSASAALGAYPFTVTATRPANSELKIDSGKTTGTSPAADYIVSLSTGPTFEVSYTDPPITVTRSPGTTNSYSLNVKVKSIAGFNSPVILKDSWVGTAPTGIAISYNPSTVTPPANGEAASKISMLVDSIGSFGTYTLRTTGTGGSTAKTADTTVRIESEITQPSGPSIALTADPPSITVSQRSTIIAQTSDKKASVPVSFTANLGDLFPTSCTTDSVGKCSVTIASSTSGTATITGSASGYTSGTTAVSIVSSGSFDYQTFLSPNSGSVAPGVTDTTRVGVFFKSGTARAVTFSCISGLPDGASCSFSPTDCTPNSGCNVLAKISTSADTPTGTYSIVVRSFSGDVQKDATYKLSVVPATCGRTQLKVFLVNFPVGFLLPSTPVNIQASIFDNCDVIMSSGKVQYAIVRGIVDCSAVNYDTLASPVVKVGNLAYSSAVWRASDSTPAEIGVYKICLKATV